MQRTRALVSGKRASASVDPDHFIIALLNWLCSLIEKKKKRHDSNFSARYMPLRFISIAASSVSISLSLVCLPASSSIGLTNTLSLATFHKLNHSFHRAIIILFVHICNFYGSAAAAAELQAHNEWMKHAYFSTVKWRQVERREKRTYNAELRFDCCLLTLVGARTPLNSIQEIVENLFASYVCASPRTLLG